MTTVKRTMFSYPLQLDSEREYPATAEPAVYPFKIAVPSGADCPPAGSGTDAGDIHAGGRRIGGGPESVGPPRWTLEGHLDLPLAFDLNAEVRIGSTS